MRLARSPRAVTAVSKSKRVSTPTPSAAETFTVRNAGSTPRRALNALARFTNVRSANNDAWFQTLIRNPFGNSSGRPDVSPELTHTLVTPTDTKQLSPNTIHQADLIPGSA